ncbi:serine/threonine protein kinase [Desulfogranum marinum]|jgi:Ser/Thr protein kinase RdoA (MazF antagonist)|uniref:serine/threonine protein kinase n=1 Tax=Desulfogranum marinum TaxID=453220 RepID=UPI0029C6A31C|nr:serine/threonine protein kinase [Desulfogranum marinum]
MNTKESSTGGVFSALTPDAILNLAEKELGIYLSNLCRPLNSYINRVYELEDEDGNGIIIKFFRPGRWSKEALLEEHQFLHQLAKDEIPVITPLPLQKGGTLGCYENIFFTLFPKKGGRYVDELNDGQWLELGRLLGRTHVVGAAGSFAHRPTIRPDQSTQAHLRYILESGLLTEELAADYEAVVQRFIREASPLFEDTDMIRIHGDCHSGNLIYRPGESFYLIDLDDIATGPPVQDFWMLLPGTLDSAFVEIDLFLEGYETFRSFDNRSLALMEPLRAMRFVHYTAWCAYQVKEDGHSVVVPDFGSAAYWQQEIADLEDQLERMQEPVNIPGNSW